MEYAGPKNNYEYRPLTEPRAIRLIELQPSADPNATPECILLHTTLSDLNDEVIYHYCALSYVWGSTKDIKLIVVDGQELRVTTNLAMALLYLRDSKIARYLWVDAICINQNDDEEKAIQVIHMGEVYKAARHTIIWLGEGGIHGQAEHTLACIRDAKKEKQAWERLALTDVSQGSEALERLHLDGLERLIDRPWFTRVWIYQELVFSPDPWLQLGSTRARWADVSMVIASSLSHQDRLSEPYKRFLAMDKARKDFHVQLQKESRSNVLFNTLVARRGLGVFDPRDMIFAHLGIVRESPLDGTPEEWDLLRADYKIDCSELYRNVAQYLTQRIEIFELLSHVEAASDQRHPDTPSWAPNWMAKPLPLPYRRLSISVTALRKQYEESHYRLEGKLDDSIGSLLLRTLPKSYKLWLSPSIISFLGFRMGTISRLSDIITHDGGSRNVENWIQISPQGQGRLYDESERRIYRGWWNIFSPLLENKSRYDRMFQLGVDRLRAQYPHDLALTDDDLFVHVLLHETRPDNATYPHFLYGRRFAWVYGRGLAVVPSAAQINDDAYFFLEKTTLPFLLRPLLAATNHPWIDSKIRDTFRPRNPSKFPQVNHFEFVGECVLQDFIFSSLDGRYFSDPSGEYYPGTFETFVIH